MRRYKRPLLTVGAALLIGTFLIVAFFSKQLIKEDQSLNILVLGVAGGEHPGAQLTDTIILANINRTENEVILISIPRDLYIKRIQGKINVAYVLGEEKGKGEGFSLIKDILYETTGLKADYIAKIDFTAFEKLIDLVGGVDIDVENSFIDPGYPIPGQDSDLCGIPDQEQKLTTPTARLWEIFPCRYDILSFNKGLTHMDGETALKFSRSRNAEGDEGTDFARSRRQQKVIVALRQKLLDSGILLNPLKLIAFYNIVSKNIETDIGLLHADDLIGLVQKLKGAKVRNIVIDSGNQEKGTPGLLVNPPVEEYGSWVLVPRRGEENFTEIKEYINCEIEKGNCKID